MAESRVVGEGLVAKSRVRAPSRRRSLSRRLNEHVIQDGLDAHTTMAEINTSITGMEFPLKREHD